MSRKYEEAEEMLPVIREMQEAGKTHREIAEHLGQSGKTVVKQLLKSARQSAAMPTAIGTTCIRQS